MSKLRLTDIRKSYRSGEIVHALKGVSLEFRESEFVSILGPSGCGKTTLLNIIGGLDRYDEGDLSLGGKSTRHFRDKDWDAYRNRSVGFVFQNYNLISHQTVLQNVEIAMTLSGVSGSERRARAKRALEAVGIGDQLKKKPNQLSGGQMQRVAIARALVNNPDIILADEPTGALDSQTSLQVMEILKDISKTKLVIMVTHNSDLAAAYSSRIIHLRDGEVQSDSNPLLKDKAAKKQDDAREEGKLSLGRTSMSLATAMSLSFRNLLTKKGRTIITSFAGSIGIIGVALVLALSTGLSGYIANLQSETLASFPLTISENAQNVQSPPGGGGGPFGGNAAGEEAQFPDGDVLVGHDPSANIQRHTNVLTPDYFDYIANIQTALPDAVNAVSYGKGVEMNLLAKAGEDVVKFPTSAGVSGFGAPQTYWQELPGNSEFVLSLYDVIGEGSRYPTAMNEVAIVVDEYNRINKALFTNIGIFEENTGYKLSDFIGKTILKLIPNDSFYTQSENGLFVPAAAESYAELYGRADGIGLTITGILRIKEGVSSTSGYLSEGLVYTTALTEYIADNAQRSAVALAQHASDRDVILNAPFADEEARQSRMRALGADTTPSSISIYPKSFAGKDEIKQYLDAYNSDKAEADRVLYTDLSEIIGSAIQTVLDTVSYVLIGFAAISLVVSTIMIGIITYVSVLERTKEIGILRSMGARKKDISRVFNAETLLVGFVAGSLGIAIAYMLTAAANGIIANLVDLEGIARLTAAHAAALVLGSMLLTLIAGLLPARMAAQRDPVIALRTE